jgi:hypothetical protein
MGKRVLLGVSRSNHLIRLFQVRINDPIPYIVFKLCQKLEATPHCPGKPREEFANPEIWLLGRRGQKVLSVVIRKVKDGTRL